MKNLIENLPKYVLLAALLAWAASFIHELGFYSSLGLQLHEIPFTPTDQLKIWLVLIPAALGLIMAMPYVQIVFFAVMEDQEKAKKYSTNTTKWKRLTPKIRFWIIVLLASSIFLVFASTSSSLYFAVFWLALSLFLRFDGIIQTEGKHSLQWYFIFIPFLVFVLFFIGESSAKTRLKNAPNAEIYVRLTDGKTEVKTGKILRTYEKFILFSEASGSYSLQATTDITNIKVIAKTPNLAYLCAKFKLLCVD